MWLCGYRSATLMVSRSHVFGYLFAILAGTVWGTTGPLSQRLYSEGAALTGIGFWRILIATTGFLAYGVARPAIFRIDRRGLVLVAGVGGAFVALFEVAYQFGIAGAGVAGAAALLYIAPVIITVLAKPLLGEVLSPLRLGLAIVVMAGAALTVRGGPSEVGLDPSLPSLAQGIGGGLLAAVSYAALTLVARWAVPRYGAVKVLFYEIAGGSLVLAVVLTLAGRPPLPPSTAGAWMFMLALALGPVLAANFLFFAAVRRIDAAPTAVGATIEPVVGAVLALYFFSQQLTILGWVGLLLVVGGVATGYVREAREDQAEISAA